MYQIHREDVTLTRGWIRYHRLGVCTDLKVEDTAIDTARVKESIMVDYTANESTMMDYKVLYLDAEHSLSHTQLQSNQMWNLNNWILFKKKLLSQTLMTSCTLNSESYIIFNVIRKIRRCLIFVFFSQNSRS